MNQRIVASTFFGLATCIGIGDLIALVMALGNPAESAAQLGVTERAATIRAIILLALALVIALNSMIALMGVLLRQPLMTQFGAMMAGVGFVLYGVYQLGSALLQHGRLLFAGIGIIYFGLAWLAFRLARAPARRKASAGA